MKVLIACEFSGIVRDAFARRGHDAWSCDLLPTEQPGQHIVGDALDLLQREWDLIIAHPPCRVLNHAGVRWLYKDGKRWLKDKAGKIIGENPRSEKRWLELEESIQFFLKFRNANSPRIAVENSGMHPYALKAVGKPTQEIQPWQFGHGEVKETCLWLKGLPKLSPTNIVSGRVPRVHFASPGPDRWKERSRTMIRIANAMADQWGGL